jgi:hypothetical protein
MFATRHKEKLNHAKSKRLKTFVSLWQNRAGYLHFHRRSHFPEIPIIEYDQCYNNGNVTNKLCEIQRFVKYQKGNGKIEQGIEVHQNPDGTGIDLVEGIQVQEQRQYRKEAGDHNNDTIKPPGNRDFIH